LRIPPVKSDVLARLGRIITENILGNGSKRPVTAETPLLSYGLDLDSVAVLQLIMAVEVEFGVYFDEHDLSVELFRTTGTLAEAVARKMSAQSRAPQG
jgi:acyl carrier protein